MNEINEKPGEAMAADVAKLTASQTSVAGRIRNYFLTRRGTGPRVISRGQFQEPV